MPRTVKQPKDDLPLTVIQPSFMDVLQLWKREMTPEREALLAVFKSLPLIEQNKLIGMAKNGKIPGGLIRITWDAFQEQTPEDRDG